MSIPLLCCLKQYGLTYSSSTLTSVSIAPGTHLFFFFFIPPQPRNIFLRGYNCHVRIGDFGLACGNIIVDSHNRTTSPGGGNCVFQNKLHISEPPIDGTISSEVTFLLCVCILQIQLILQVLAHLCMLHRNN